MIMCDSRRDPDRERRHLTTLLGRRIDGLIVTGRCSNPRPPIASSLPFPVVYAHTPSTDPRDCSANGRRRGSRPAGRAPSDRGGAPRGSAISPARRTSTPSPAGRPVRPMACRVGERRLDRAAHGGPTGLVSSRRHLDPCMRFSRTRLSDVLHRRHSAHFPRHARCGRGATTVPLRSISPRRSGDWKAKTDQP